MVRQVKVYQSSGISILEQENVCFVALLSLKKHTLENSLNHQRILPTHFRLNSPFENLEFVEIAPDLDTPEWTNLAKSGEYDFKDESHPVEVRKLDMGSYNDGKEVFEKTQVCFYSADSTVTKLT